VLLIYSFQFRSACLPQWPACRNCGMFILISLLAKNKVTIHPGFSRTVPFNDVSREKITVLPGHPYVPFLAWCPGFIPTLTNCTISLYEYQYLPTGAQNPKGWNVYAKKLLADGAQPQTPLGELTMLLQAPKLDSRWLANVALASYDSRPGLWRPNYGHLSQKGTFSSCDF